MLERFTDRARRVMVLAQESARDLNHTYVDTEHLLSALVSPKVAQDKLGEILTGIGLTPDIVRQQILAIVGEGQLSFSGHLSFTPRAKKVLEYAIREALQFGHTSVQPEHILLGLLREGEGVGCQIITTMIFRGDHGMQVSLRQQVVALLQGQEQTRRLSPRPEAVAINLGNVPKSLAAVEAALRRNALATELLALHNSMLHTLKDYYDAVDRLLTEYDRAEQPQDATPQDSATPEPRPQNATAGDSDSGTEEVG